MKIKQLHWKVHDVHPTIWIAQIEGYGIIQFEIHQIPKELLYVPQLRFLLKSNIVGIKEILLSELDFAKELAQVQLEIHVDSLLESHP